MNKKTKIKILLTFLGVAILILTGCSSGTTTPSTKETAEPEASNIEVRNLETAVTSDSPELLADKIPEEGVSVNISGEETLYNKNDSEKLINDIKEEVNTKKFNLINKETNIEKDTMLISGEIVESYSPTNTISESNNTSTYLASNQIESQFSSDNFVIETPDNWKEESLTVDEGNVDLYSAYSLDIDEGVSIIYLNLNSDEKIDLSEITSNNVRQYFDSISKELEDLGIYNLEITDTENTKVNKKQAIRIDGNFDTEYRLFQLVLEYKEINNKYFLYNISIKKIDKSESTIKRRETAYLINDNNNLVLIDYVADSSQYKEANIQKIIGSFVSN